MLAIVILPAAWPVLLLQPHLHGTRKSAKAFCATIEKSRRHAQHWLFFFSGALSVSTRPLAGAVTVAVLGSLRAIS